MSANPVLVSSITENLPIVNGRAESKDEATDGVNPHATDNVKHVRPNGLQIFPDTVIENLRPLRVVVIGAGFSGIYMGIRIPEWLRNVDLTIYEKNPAVGGTWYENRYPGCACDIPAHSYTYTFEPNPRWSTFYAGAAEIQGYLQRACDKYGAKRFIKFGHKVTRCQWNQKVNKWCIL